MIMAIRMRQRLDESKSMSLKYTGQIYKVRLSAPVTEEA